MSLTRVLFSLALISLLITVASANYEYNRNTGKDPDFKEDNQSHQSLVDHDLPNPEYNGLNYNDVIIQGVILCNSGSSYTPLKGAVARIACTNSYGYEYTYSILSPETDENGYFYTPLLNSDITDIKMCKVYLEHSPSETCNVPTKSGIIGAPLSLCLGTEIDKIYYTMGTLFYSTETTTSYNSAPKKDLDSNNNNGY